MCICVYVSASVAHHSPLCFLLMSTTLKILSFLPSLQSTINCASMAIAFLGPFIGYDFPLTLIQLLWVNLGTLKTKAKQQPCVPSNHINYFLLKKMLLYYYYCLLHWN